MTDYMNLMMIRACQDAAARLKDRLTIPPEAFNDGCLVAATACMEASHLSTSPQASRFVQPCIDWMAAVGGWLKDAEPQAHLRSVGIDVHPGRESPYLTLFQIPSLVPLLHSEYLHPHIDTQCEAIATASWEAHRGCGSLQNLNRICRSVAYLRCQAPLPWKPAEQVEHSFQITKCVNRLAADPEASLGDVSAQVYYFKPTTQYTCMPLPDRPYLHMALPEAASPTDAACKPTPPGDGGTYHYKGLQLSVDAAFKLARALMSEQLQVGSGVYWNTLSFTTGVSGSLRHTAIGLVRSGGFFLGGQWQFWQPAPSVEFVVTATAGSEFDSQHAYPYAQAGVGTLFPQVFGKTVIPSVRVGYALQRDWLHSILVALNISSRF